MRIKIEKDKYDNGARIAITEGNKSGIFDIEFFETSTELELSKSDEDYTKCRLYPDMDVKVKLLKGTCNIDIKEGEKIAKLKVYKPSDKKKGFIEVDIDLPQDSEHFKSFDEFRSLKFKPNTGIKCIDDNIICQQINGRMILIGMTNLYSIFHEEDASKNLVCFKFDSILLNLELVKGIITGYKFRRGKIDTNIE